MSVVHPFKQTGMQKGFSTCEDNTVYILCIWRIHYLLEKIIRHNGLFMEYFSVLLQHVTMWTSSGTFKGGGDQKIARQGHFILSKHR
jgi:hypothetical protein